MPSTTTMLILRIAQAAAAVIVLGLGADAVSSLVFSQMEFLLFCASFAILSNGYLILASFMNGISHIYITLTLDALNTIFFFAGFIAVAAVIDVGNCENLAFTAYYSYVTPCQCAQASSGVGALSWLLWVATLILNARDAYLNRATTVTPQAAVVAKESSSDAGIWEAGISEAGLKETGNEEESQAGARPQMSDPDI